jgi:hypothetical protein
MIFMNFVLAPLSRAAIKQGTIEFMMGRYSVSEPRFTAVYKEGGAVNGLVLSAMLIRDFNFYLEIKYFKKTGLLTYTQEKSDFYLLPISLGVRYILPLGIFQPYAGAGGDFYIYYEKNPIGNVLNHTSGLHALAGVYVQFGKLPFFLNLKLKYTHARAEEQGKTLQLGGWEYGAGLAFSF